MYGHGANRAGLSIVPVAPWEGPPSQGAPADQLPNFYHAVLNVTTTKNRSSTFLEKSAPPQIIKSWLRVREKGPRLTLVCLPPNG